jgi:carboxylesterase type B
MQEENHLHLSSGEPTYWPSDSNKHPDLLDFFITKATSSHYADTVSNLDLTSDHTPVKGTIRTKVIYISPKPSMYNNRTDWGLFKENVRNNFRLNTSLKTEREIDEATNDLITTIQRAAWSAPPITTKTIRNDVNIPHEILQLVREKRRAREKWYRTRNPVDKNLHNRLANNLKTKINAVKQETYQHFLSQLSTTDNTIWKLTKNGKSPQKTNPPIRKPTGE